MREVKASDANAQLPELLKDVEQGESFVITQHGRPIARLVPEMDQRRIELEKVFADIDALRGTLPAMTLDEILAARHEGHKY